MGNFKEGDPGKLTVQSSTDQKEKGWGEKPHEELVKEVRALLQSDTNAMAATYLLRRSSAQNCGHSTGLE